MSESRNQFNSKAVLGALMHTGQYFRASLKDIVIPNPHFNYSALNNPHSRGIGMYCIHGTADRNGSFLKIADGLLDPTRAPALSVNYSGIHLLSFGKRGRGQSIRFFAEELRAKINKNGHTHVMLMGHSRGGLVAAYYAEHLAPSDGVIVHGAVLICSPVSGAMLAMKPLSSISESVKEMESNSEFTNALGAKIVEANKQKKYYFVAAQSDSIVHPEAAYLKENCHSLYFAPEHGHLSMMRSTRLIEHLMDCANTIAERFLTSRAARQITEIKVAENVVVPKPPTMSVTLSTLIDEIDKEIERLQRESHLFSSSAKERALKQLQTILTKRLSANPIVGAKSVGNVLAKALHERETKSNKMLYEVIIEPLNGLFSLLKSTHPQSQTFLHNLLKKYMNVAIPQNPLQVNVVLDSEPSHEILPSPSFK